MSCNYYRVMPEPPRAEVYGFKKVTQEELGNIISRLSRPTYNSRVHTVEAHKAHNYRKIHSAPPPRTPTQCSRRRLSTPNPSNVIAAMRLSNSDNNNNNNYNNTNNIGSSTPSPNPTSAENVAATPDQTSDGNNQPTDVENTDTIDGSNRDNSNDTNDITTFDENDEEANENTSESMSPGPGLPSPPPQPPGPLSERKMTELELRRFLRRIQRPTRASSRSRRDYVPEEDDEIMAGDDFATFNTVERNRRPLTTTERRKAFFLLSRPTAASKAKSSVDSAFCFAHEEERKANRNLNLPFKYPHAPEVRVVTPGEASSIVSRVSSPTRASLRGAGPPCYRSGPDYNAVRGQHPSLPLVSGLARTPNVSQIVNRLHYGTTKRIVVVVREEETEESEEDRRGSRGASCEDERGRHRRAAPSARRLQKSSNTRGQVHNSRRSYHGYHTAATPITAWS